jgi:hypothetical protein
MNQCGIWDNWLALGFATPTFNSLKHCLESAEIISVLKHPQAEWQISFSNSSWPADNNNGIWIVQMCCSRNRVRIELVKEFKRLR